MKAYSAGPDNASRSTAKRRAFFAVQNVAYGPSRHLVRRGGAVAIGREADMARTPQFGRS
jgi:hypothetical protein